MPRRRHGCRVDAVEAGKNARNAYYEKSGLKSISTR
jgi:hypothetical protein